MFDNKTRQKLFEDCDFKSEKEMEKVAEELLLYVINDIKNGSAYFDNTSFEFVKKMRSKKYIFILENEWEKLTYPEQSQFVAQARFLIDNKYVTHLTDERLLAKQIFISQKATASKKLNQQQTE